MLSNQAACTFLRFSSPAVVFKLDSVSESPGKIAGPISRVSNSVGLWWGPKICTANKIPDQTDAVGVGPHFEDHCSGETLKHVNMIFCTRMFIAAFVGNSENKKTVTTQIFLEERMKK